MIKKECVLFLDFDGVLHFFWPQDDSTDEENQFFYFVPQFERFIRSFSDTVDFKGSVLLYSPTFTLPFTA